MTWVASAIVGAGALAGGGAIGGALIGSSASKTAAGQMADAAMNAEMGLNQRFQQALSFLAPYQQYGLQAGATLSNLFTSPQETLNARAQERLQLEGAIPRPLTDADFPVLSGKNASERWQTMVTQGVAQRNQEIASAKDKLSTFDKQTDLIKQQQQQQGNNPVDILQSSPAYQYAAELTNRQLAATGQLNSGAAIRAQGGLAAALVGTQTQNLQNLYNTGATAAAQGANTAGVFGQAIGNTQILGGQAQAQGTLGSAQYLTSGIQGAGNAISGSASSLLNYNLYNNLIQQANSGGTGQYNLSGSLFPQTSGTSPFAAQSGYTNPLGTGGGLTTGVPALKPMNFALEGG